MLYNNRYVIASLGTCNSKPAWFKTNNLDFDSPVRRPQKKIITYTDFASAHFAGENNRSPCNQDGIDHSAFEGHMI